jgi:hypothetical protein
LLLRKRKTSRRRMMIRKTRAGVMEMRRQPAKTEIRIIEKEKTAF